VRGPRLACAAACLTAAACSAQPLALPPPPQARLTQRPGAALPLDAALRDELGQSVRLGDFFVAGQPVLLVLGYYRCTELCGLLMHGLLEGLQAAGLPRTGWRIVGISIDPQDTPADARSRRALDLAYADFLQGAGDDAAPLRLDLLLADAATVQRIAQAAGFGFQPLVPARAGSAAFAHPAVVVVATPAGAVSAYLQGVRFEGPRLREALQRAAAGGTGSLLERFSLLCAHFDPAPGRHDAGVLLALRISGALTLGGLLFLAWRQRPRGRPR
jgi:protein SCO1/2